MRLQRWLVLSSLVIVIASFCGCFGCGADTNIPDGYAGPTPSGPDLGPALPDGGTYIHVDIGNGASIDGAISGSEITLVAAPTSFSAPLHVTSVARAGHPVHSRADLAAACAVPLASGEAPTFSGDFLFDPLEQKFLDTTIVASGAGRIEQLTTAWVTNTPSITAAKTTEPSLAPAAKAALASPPHDAPFTSSNWALLCNSLSTAPDLSLEIFGTFDGKPYSGEIHIDALSVDVR